MKYYLTLFFTVSVVWNSFAQSANGDLIQNTTWSGEIHLTGNVFVKNGVTLTIEPGTKVLSDGFYSINFEGTANLLARGTSANPISFKPTSTTGFSLEDNSETGAWNGIRFLDATEPDSIILEHCHISHGKAVKDFTDFKYAYGGGLFLQGDGYTPFEKLKIEYSTFDSCYAVAGGAIWIADADLKITNSVFSNCYADYGGGIQTRRSDNQIFNCLFYNNKSITGAAIYVFEQSPVFMLNCTVVNNKAQYAAAFYSKYDYDATIINSILYNNIASVKGDHILSDGLIFNCNVSGGKPDSISSINYLNCIDSDPLFNDPENEDFSLQESSPNIDAGEKGYDEYITSFDLSGENRVSGDQIDIGAYEYQIITGSGTFGNEKNNLAFYPNPTNEILYIEVEESVTQITITDMRGRLIETIPINNGFVSVSVSEYSTGIYFLQFENEKEKIAQKSFVKQ